MKFSTMIGTALLCLTTLYLNRAAAQGDCTDFRGRSISHGLHYVPGPDTCTLCVCDNGSPKVCKAVLCSPPQDCRSFRVGNTCCEFICLDDVVKGEGAEASVRVAAGGAAALVLLTAALVVCRVRRQKRRRPPPHDQRSLTSIGYISGSMGYMGGTCETALAGWKPPGNYMPRGEAPPPYDEAVAQGRNESVRMGAETPYHRTYPSTMEALTRPEEPAPCVGHPYANMPRPMPQMANPQNCYNAPLLQPAHPPEPRDPNPVPHHPLAANVIGFPSAIRLTGSLGAISGRALLSVAREPDHERPHNVPGFYTNTPALHTSLHRTIPRISTATDGAPDACFARGERALHAEVRRSFHRAERERDVRRDARSDTGRSMPRNLNLADRDVRVPEPPLHEQPLARLVLSAAPDAGAAGGGAAGREGAREAGEAPPAPPPCACEPPAPPAPPHATLPLTVDKPSCVCSYEGSNAPGAEETDDYRSECENCKSASSSRWVLEAGWEAEAADGTQTLQRAPPAPAPPATNTLPQPVTKPSRNIMGPLQTGRIGSTPFRIPTPSPKRSKG